MHSRTLFKEYSHFIFTLSPHMQLHMYSLCSAIIYSTDNNNHIFRSDFKMDEAEVEDEDE